MASSGSKDRVAYWSLRSVFFCIQWLPRSWIHAFGKQVGTLIFWCYPRVRKRILSNLTLAFGSQRSSNEIKEMARRSCQHLAINTLEYAILHRMDPGTIVSVHPDSRHHLEICCQRAREGKGFVVFGGHQSHWEWSFLYINHLMPGGTSIAQPLQNVCLNQWIMQLRTSTGGEVFLKQQAFRYGLRALKQGKYFTMFADQSFAHSKKSYCLFGHPVWLSSLPVRLAYRAQVPIFVWGIQRTTTGYEVRVTPPVWVEQQSSRGHEIDACMQALVTRLEEYILLAPEQWLWVHQFLKPPAHPEVLRKYQHRAVLVLVHPQDQMQVKRVMEHLYPHSLLTFYDASHPDLLKKQYQFQLVIDCIDIPQVRKHYARLSALHVLKTKPSELYDLLSRRKD